MTSGLKMLPSACGLGQHFQDLGHSFSLYGPPSRQITYIYAIDVCALFTYANDTQLFKSAEDIDQVEHAINADLKKVDEWYEFNEMKSFKIPSNYFSKG